MLKLKNVVVALGIALIAAGTRAADEQPATESVTLMGMLQEWIYPEAGFGGAQTSDAAVTDITAVKSKAILTTPDPVEKVLEFYLKKLNVDREGQTLGGNEGEQVRAERSVLIQAVPMKDAPGLYIIAINSPVSSTTLVISRAKEAAVTHIAWSNFRRLGP